MYGPACEREGMNFVPLPVDVFGAWHLVAIKHLKNISATLAKATCRDDSIPIQHLFQRLGILLFKGNINLILNRIPLYIQPEINGILLAPLLTISKPSMPRKLDSQTHTPKNQTQN